MAWMFQWNIHMSCTHVPTHVAKGQASTCLACGVASSTCRLPKGGFIGHSLVIGWLTCIIAVTAKYRSPTNTVILVPKNANVLTVSYSFGGLNLSHKQRFLRVIYISIFCGTVTGN